MRCQKEGGALPGPDGLGATWAGKLAWRSDMELHSGAEMKESKPH